MPDNNSNASPFFSAEVKEVIYTDNNPSLVYGIKVKILDNTISNDDESVTLITAIPINYNILRIPIVGEVVLIIQAPSSYASGTRKTTTYYYTDIVSLQSSIHHNSIPSVSKITTTQGQSGDSKDYNETSTGNSKKEKDPVPDVNFQENAASKPLQHYIGDVILSGRYGNSIRFSTSPKSGAFKVPAKFSGAPGSPITIFRNTTQSKDTKKINDFVTENFTNEENVIVQASGQKLEFEQASSLLEASKSAKVTSWKDENWGTTPQTLISAGRIVFNSTQKEIIAFAKSGIALSTETSIGLDAKESIILNAAKMQLGVDADEPLILGNKFKTWMENLIQAISTLTPVSPVGPCSPLTAAPQWAAIESLKAQITPLLLSDSAFTKKKAIATPGSSAKFKTIPAPTFEMTPEQVAAAEEKKEDAAQRHEDPQLTPEEKKSVADYHNLQEKQIKEVSLVSAPIEAGTIEPQDIDVNADANMQVVYAGEVEETDGAAIEGEDIDEGDELPVDAFWDYQFINESYEDVTKSTETYVLQSVSADSLNAGKEAAKLAITDVNVTETTPGSRTGPRVDVYLQNINCRPTLGDWGNGAVATWHKESGLPIPPTNSSSANGWYVWAKKTNRWIATPVIGSVAVYGVKNPAGAAEPFNAHHLGLVIQIVEGENAVITCENIDGVISQAQTRIDAILGFIIPSKSDIEKPKLDYSEPADTSKGGGLKDESQPLTGTIKQQAIQALKEVVDKVLSKGEEHGKCGKYTFNHAYQFIRKLKGQTVEPGPKYAAGGNANMDSYHKNLQKIGYTKTDFGTVDQNALRNYLTSPTNWSPGDVAVYWCIEGVAPNVSSRKYGHTQMYTAKQHNRATCSWTTDNRNNYGCAHVYNVPNSKWRFIKFKSPADKLLS